jgi:uncharacterized protein YcfJ
MRTVISTAVALAFANAAFAAQDLTDTAQVISSTPIVERIYEPRQECWQEAAPAPGQDRSVVAPIVGGVAGALLGSQVGRGSGKTAATAAGAVAGTVIGDRVANPDSNRPITGAVVGGAAGGLLGAQVGSGSGRNAAAAAGAIGGSVIGDRVQNPQTAGIQPVQRCRTVEGPRDVVRGYTVVYRYNGRDITTTLPYNPGSTVRVGVGVVDGPPTYPAAGTYPPPGAVAPYPRDVTTTNAPPPPPPGTYSYPTQYPSQQQAPGRY